MASFEASADRRRWEESTPGLYTIALLGPPTGAPLAEVGLELARASARQENYHRMARRVLLVELDFWAPSLSYAAGLHDRAAKKGDGDFLGVIQVMTEERFGKLQTRLRESEGIPRSERETQEWSNQLENLFPPSLYLEEEPGLAVFPAKVGREAFRRSLDVTHGHLVAIDAEPIFVPGIAVLRALLLAAARKHRAGMIFLLLPSGWQAFSPLVCSRLADLVLMVSEGRKEEDRFWEPVVEFLVESRRRGEVVRRDSAEEIHLLLTRDAPAQPLEILRELRSSFDLGYGSEGLDGEGVKKLATEIDKLAASKESGIEVRYVDDPKGADLELMKWIAELPPEAARFPILVEAGAYGEYPMKKLSERTSEVLSDLSDGASPLQLEPVPITHKDLLEFVLESGDESDPELGFSARLKQRLEENSDEEVDQPVLITFPHYMLGALVRQEALLPWHVVERRARKQGVDVYPEADIEKTFHETGEMCRFNGVLYALPYSLLQKVILVKQGCPIDRLPPTWGELKDDLKRKSGGAAWPLLMETKTDHVGIWYDWLEFVTAFGGADFRSEKERKEGFRGSDYGECWLNHPRTIEATQFYLKLLQRTLERYEKPIDWDRLLIEYEKNESVWLTVAWSDIVGYHWKKRDQASDDSMGLAEGNRIYPFPSGNDQARTSIEGWVVAIPKDLDESRQLQAGRLLSWFLSPQVQKRYAEVGGNTARRHLGHALGEVQRLVQRAIFLSGRESALKATFVESPRLVQQTGKTLAGWLKRMVDGEGVPERDEIEGALDELAREVADEVLRYKVKYRPLSYWKEKAQDGLERRGSR